MIDFKLLGGFGDGRTDRRTDERTFVVVESLSRLKPSILANFGFLVNFIRHTGPMVTMGHQVHRWAISASTGQKELGKN